MALILIGIYALVREKVRISPRCGLMGKGARIAGAFYMILGVGFITFFGFGIVAATKSIGLPFGAAVAASGVLQAATFFLVPLILMRVYGNAFGRHRHRKEGFLRDQ
jgi:hypothetical protein